MKFFILLAALMTSTLATANCPKFDVPTSFQAKEELISIGTDMALVSNGSRIGEIEERTLRFSPNFDLYNIHGRKVANGRQRILSWGTIIDVKDCTGKVIGTIKENIIHSLFSLFTRYDIYNPAGKMIGSSGKVDFWSTQFIITSPSGEEIMRMKRPAINILRDNWSIKISKKNVIDPRIMIMIPAFKTSADNRRRAEEEARNSSY